MRRHAVLLLLLAAGTLGATDTVYTPTYSARWGDDGVLREILAELRALRLEVSALRRQQSNEKPAGSLKELVAMRCGRCHNEAEAAKKGGGLVWLTKDGKVPALSLAEKKLIMGSVDRGQMPPGAPLTADERQQLRDFLYPKLEDVP